MAESRGTRRTGGARKTTTGKRPSTARAKAGAGAKRGSASSAKRSAAATKGGKARGRQQTAQKTAGRAARAATKPAKAAGVEAKTVAEFREALRKSLVKPTGMVLLTREHIEDALQKTGKLSPKQARGVASDLVKRGRKETSDFLDDLEGLLDKGKASARRATRKAPALPIRGYEKLNVGQIRARVSKLSPPDLRKLRDHERKGAGRKGVLDAIESALKR
jgi:polyhydroxyalkanoate synthesis regulator phasin